MMTNTQTFLLQCLSDHLHKAPSTQVSDLNWDELMSVGKKQSVDAIVYHQCIHLLPENKKRMYLRSYIAHASISYRRQKEMEELLSFLEEKNIKLICMKGSVFRDMYPLSVLRNMGDIDFIIRDKDREAVDQILCKKMGYKRFIDNQAVWTYGKENMYFEVHTHMFYEYLANDKNYQKYFDAVWNHCRKSSVFNVSSDCLYIPEENFHLLYLMAHTAKHITNKGSGFRPYLDMILFTEKCSNKLDWKYLEEELKQLQLLEFTRTCFTLCEYWFGIKMPLKPKNLSEEFIASSTKKTFDDGIFGLDNPENKSANAAKELKRSHYPKLLSSVILMWKRLFPPYRVMKLVPWYSFIDGKPWLMPYAWVYRWIYCIKNKREQGIDLLTEPFTKEDIIYARENWLRQWGL